MTVKIFYKTFNRKTGKSGAMREKSFEIGADGGDEPEIKTRAKSAFWEWRRGLSGKSKMNVEISEVKI